MTQISENWRGLTPEQNTKAAYARREMASRVDGVVLSSNPEVQSLLRYGFSEHLSKDDIIRTNATREFLKRAGLIEVVYEPKKVVVIGTDEFSQISTVSTQYHRVHGSSSVVVLEVRYFQDEEELGVGFLIKKDKTYSRDFLHTRNRG